jgi:predicted restriction endonuclease
MIGANVSNKIRKEVYRRDGFRCALCDSTIGIQLHHVVKRSQGGTESPQNLITLCSDCHALAHGMNLRRWVDIDESAISQAIVEYMADTYPGTWNPWAKGSEPWNERDKPP